MSETPNTCVTVRQGLGAAPGATGPLTGRTEEKATGWVDTCTGEKLRDLRDGTEAPRQPEAATEGPGPGGGV